MTGITVEAQDLHHARHMIYGKDGRSAYLTIEPLMDFDRDLPRMPGARALPTTRFAIRWSGANEMFLREVNSVKELYDVLRPIFKEHEHAKRELEKRDAQNRAMRHKKEIAEALERVKNQEKALDLARRMLAEARSDAPR